MRRFYKFCEVQKKVVPAHEVIKKYPSHHIINDEMPETRSPITGKYYTSKSKLRQEYKEHQAEEIGTAYDNGYEPEKDLERSEKQMMNRLSETFRRRLND